MVELILYTFLKSVLILLVLLIIKSNSFKQIKDKLGDGSKFSPIGKL